MAYSPRQLDMIRASLRAHKAYTTAVDGKPLTWQGLAYDIEDHSGVVMTAEVLRQFVNGVSKKNNPGRQRVPSDENIVAMVNY